MLKTSLLSSAAILAITATSVFGQDAFALDEIIVSGGLSPIAAQSYGRAASVITAQDIEDRGITNVADALRSLPGVSVSAAGNSLTNVRIRGGESRNTLVLIDGIQAAPGADGAYTFSGLETSNIDRIEVLRGPQSVYYGSSAASGVVNIITRKGEEGTSISGSIELGQGINTSAFISKRNERGGLSLSLAHRNDQGYDYSGDGGEKDGLERTTAILAGDYLLLEDFRVGFVLRKSKENSDYDGNDFFAANYDAYVFDDPNLYSDVEELTAAVYAEYSMAGGVMTHRLSLERTENQRSENGGAVRKGVTEALKYRLSYGLDGLSVAQTNHLASMLIERRDDTSGINGAYQRSSKSVAIEYRGSIMTGLDIQAGARFDNNDVFADETTWNIGLSYRFSGTGMRIHSSAGTGIVNPAYFQVNDVFGGTGNPNLTPEKNKSFDVGVEFPIFAGRGLIDVTYFNETVTDEISFVPLPNFAYTYENQMGESTREGVEVSGTMQATDDLALRMSYTYLDAKNPDGSVEVRRPRHEFSLGVTQEAFSGRGTVSADLRHVSGNFDSPKPTAELPSFTTVDVAAEYGLSSTLTLTGRITNLFDTDAQEVGGYASRGRAAYVGVRANF